MVTLIVSKIHDDMVVLRNDHVVIKKELVKGMGGAPDGLPGQAVWG